VPRSWSPRQGRAAVHSHGHPEDGITVAPQFEKGNGPDSSPFSTASSLADKTGDIPPPIQDRLATGPQAQGKLVLADVSARARNQLQSTRDQSTS